MRKQRTSTSENYILILNFLSMISLRLAYNTVVQVNSLESQIVCTEYKQILNNDHSTKECMRRFYRYTEKLLAFN